jgi:hypothetical protein
VDARNAPNTILVGSEHPLTDGAGLAAHGLPPEEARLLGALALTFIVMEASHVRFDRFAAARGAR